MKLIDDIRARLIANARDWWRFWSIRFNAAGIAVLTFAQFDPVQTLGVWNMMPAAVRAVLPTNILTIIGMTLFALSMLARVIDQKKVAK